MHTKEDYFVVSIIVFIWLFFSVTLSYFIATGVFDPTFFTYITYFTNWIFFGFLYFSFYSYPMLELVLLGLFPIVWGMTVFVFFAIIAIVAINDEVFTRGTILGGTTRTFGEQFVGDRILHVFPGVFMLITLLALNRTAGPMLNLYWKSRSRGELAAYILYVLLAPSVILGLYMATQPFEKNYLVPWTVGAVVALQIGLSILAQALLCGLAALFTNCSPIYEKLLHTPMGYLS